MAVVSRKTTRNALATLLTTATSGSVDAVYAYKPPDFGQANKVIVVTSGPIERVITGFSICEVSKIMLYVWVLVRYADPDTGWTRNNSEDAADDIEALVANAVLANQVTANWNQATYKGATMLDDVVIGGVDFLRELIQVEVEVFA